VEGKGIMKCPRCGKELPDDAKFCNECGCNLELHAKISKIKSMSLKKKIIILTAIIVIFTSVFVGLHRWRYQMHIAKLESEAKYIYEEKLAPCELEDVILVSGSDLNETENFDVYIYKYKKSDSSYADSQYVAYTLSNDIIFRLTFSQDSVDNIYLMCKTVNEYKQIDVSKID
jgi:uncharacterized membrane protein YvbJ